MYNILSILLGLMALGFATHSFQAKFCPVCCTLSFSFCCGALVCQLLEVRRRVQISDWSALMDTMDAVVFAAAALLAVTLVLNLLALFRKNKKM